MLEHHELYAYEFLGTRYDGGTPLGLLRASLEFGLAREDTRQAVSELLETFSPCSDIRTEEIPLKHEIQATNGECFGECFGD